ncbi:conserved hypothetical protein [Flavobacterium sp. 9AF]|uniref:hypothetical protein n=1 Tax=Flavobacterium sp. 9AF TaxID=2653142 RepID=UPI0012F36FE5|nr:hypothetical protein [Flavobacterium sp. 9AF]VXA91338.1 conserved hypothetical protein [Flavobacterium sp. 9AF]
MHIKLFLPILLLSFLSCSKVKNEGLTISDIPKKSSDSIIADLDENNKVVRIYSFLSTPEKPMKEMITFLRNGEIDSSKSTFLEIRNKDIYFHSPYAKNSRRFVNFFGNDSINENFNNFSKVKLDSMFFNKNGVIKNYKNVMPQRGKIVETVFLDTIIEKDNVNHSIIRTIEYYIDINNLLINKVEKIKQKK